VEHETQTTLPTSLRSSQPALPGPSVTVSTTASPVLQFSTISWTSNAIIENTETLSNTGTVLAPSNASTTIPTGFCILGSSSTLVNTSAYSVLSANTSGTYAMASTAPGYTPSNTTSQQSSPVQTSGAVLGIRPGRWARIIKAVVSTILWRRLVQPVEGLKQCAQTPLGDARTILVEVGLNLTNQIQPHWVEASIGDVIGFNFYSGNHSLTEFAFEDPCSSIGSFDTDFLGTTLHEGQVATVALEVLSASPRWFFYRRSHLQPHCLEGAVFAVNPGTYWQEFSTKASRMMSTKGSLTETVYTTTTSTTTTTVTLVA
jgi:hypothetical protein